MYEAAEFDHLTGLDGLSDELLAEHVALYEGYVENANQLTMEADGIEQPLLGPLKRQIAFEVNGMLLHELYFLNLIPASEATKPSDTMLEAIESQFDSFEAWESDFFEIALTRGPGWAILYLEPASGLMINLWIDGHERGHLAGFVPLLVIDCWEHAYMPDYKASDRKGYLEAVMKNIDWAVVENRISPEDAEEGEGD